MKNRDNKGKQQSNFRIPPELIIPTFPPVPTGFTGIGITHSTYSHTDHRMHREDFTPMGEMYLTAPQGVQDSPVAPIGATAPEGQQGAQGLRGPQGETGATGPQGVQGLQGPIYQRERLGHKVYKGYRDCKGQLSDIPEDLKEFKASKGYRVQLIHKEYKEHKGYKEQGTEWKYRCNRSNGSGANISDWNNRPNWDNWTIWRTS